MQYHEALDRSTDLLKGFECLMQQLESDKDRIFLYADMARIMGLITEETVGTECACKEVVGYAQND